MLLELRVENYAVIDNVVIEFAPGLNLLTGETGAGKSLLIDALALLLGEKASLEVVRHGAGKAVVAGVFAVDEDKAAPVLEKNGIDSNGNELILRREIATEGKSRVFINNQAATVAVLKQLAPLLGSIHSQAESMFAFAFDAEARLALLDTFAAIHAGAIADLYERWRALTTRMSEFQDDEQERLRMVDLWRFQKKEIEQAHLQPGEDQRLEDEKRVLANSDRLYTAAMSAYEQLYESSSSVAASLRSATRQMEELARFDGKFQESIAALHAARISVEDASATLREFAEGMNASPERLEEVEDRLALMARLKRKYGPSLDDILALAQSVEQRLNEVENRDQLLKELTHQHGEAASAYLRLAQEYSRRRLEAARKLEKLVESEINDLAMKARFKVELGGGDGQANWTRSGFDRVSYLISTNAGQPMGAVEQIASGGELSRVMLALKAVVSQCAKPAARSSEGSQLTLVFDEIDTGIGGRAAEAVGSKLKSLACHNQVLCITHLPQIACFADHHFSIEKKDSGGRTRIGVHHLQGEARTHEIARMLSGAIITDLTLKAAAQMLKNNR